MLTQIISDHLVVARSQHRCDSCNKLIYPGDPYFRQVQAFAGTVVTYKAHEACRRAEEIVYAELDRVDEVPRVVDMEDEDIELVEKVDYACFMAIWGKEPDHGRPEP